jgi:hypothetical protein
MSVTYTWSINPNGLLTQTVNGNENTVQTVLYNVSGTDGNNTVQISGATNIVFDANVTFTPFANLTQAQVITWVQDSLGNTRVTAMETSLSNQLTLRATPPSRPVAQQLPW